MLKRRTVKLKSTREIEAMRKAGALASQTLTAVGDISSKGRRGAEKQGTAEGQQAKQTTHRA